MEISWNTADRSAWQAATARSAWQQDWAYGEAWQQLYGPVLRAGIIEDGERIGVAQVTARRFPGGIHAATCTRGPVWHADTTPAIRHAAYRALKRSLPLPRLSGLFLTPDAEASEHETLAAARLRRVMTPFSTAMLDLTADDTTLRAAMNGKWRNRLIRAGDSALKIVPAASAAGQYDWLLEAEAAQQKNRRYRATHPALTKAWQSLSGKTGDVMVLTAKQGPDRVAAMLFLLHARGALYQFGWTSPAGRAANAHNLLLWDAMKRLRRKGIEVLDLGGLDTRDNPGIARFKLGAGARVRTLCGISRWRVGCEARPCDALITFRFAATISSR